MLRLTLAVLALAALAAGCGGHGTEAGRDGPADGIGGDGGDGGLRDGSGGDGGAGDGTVDAADDGHGGDGGAGDGGSGDGGSGDGGGGGDGGAGDGGQHDGAPQQDAQHDTAPQQDAQHDTAPQQDAGTGEVWVEIDYSNAYTPQSPGWSFSATPGWGAAQWAMQGDTWPEAWDRWNNMTVSGSEPIGRSLIIGPGSELQLMIGLEELVSYTGATVRLEGRSYSTYASVYFDVYNPLNDCGVANLQMSNDWSVHVVEVDLDSCLIAGAGGGVEAVRVEPVSGSDAMALVRLRVTLHGAIW